MPFAQDLRFALRRAALRPGFTAAALLTIALGIGATTALFSVVRAVLLRPLPYPEPERVVVLWNMLYPDDETWLSWREIVEYRRASHAFTELAAFTDFAANLTGAGEPERVVAASVTADGFTVLGAAPLLGRTFTADEEVPGREQVVLLGEALWRRRYGGDPGIVGGSVHLDGKPYTVVGVLPADFHLPLSYRDEQPPQLWVPLALGPDAFEDWGDRYLYAFGRLRPDVTPEAASRELAAIGKRWVEAGHVYDQGDRRIERSAVPVAELMTRRIRPALRVLMGTVACILLIACVNVTNLLLTAAEGRRREVAVLVALGAGRGRLLTQLLTESLLLAVGGGALGLALAYAATRLLVALAPGAVPRVETVGLDAPAFLFAAGAVVATGLLFGLAPALQGARAEVSGVLQGARGATAGPPRQRFRRALVVAETALSVALLIGSGLMLRSLWQLRQVDLGLDPSRVLTAQLTLPASDYAGAAEIAGFYERLVAEVEALPGVESAGAVRMLPLTGIIGDWSITLEGKPHDPRENPNGDWQVATPGYLETLGVRLERGRFLRDSDRGDVPFAAVVNRSMAARYWPGRDPLGQRFRLGTAPDRPWFSIVGVFADVHHNGVVEEPRTEMVLPLEQFQLATGSLRRGMTLVVKSRGEPLAVAAAVRAAVRRLDPRLPVARLRTMDEVVGTALSQPRFMALLLALFAGLALALAAVGLYGVIAYGVAARGHEIGIRVVLGATRPRVLRLVLSEGMAMAAAGIGIGLALARLLTRFLAGQIYGVTADDPATFAAVPLLLAAVALAATWLPARRAARLDPATTLRAG